MLIVNQPRILSNCTQFIQIGTIWFLFCVNVKTKLVVDVIYVEMKWFLSISIEYLFSRLFSHLSALIAHRSQELFSFSTYTGYHSTCVYILGSSNFLMIILVLIQLEGSLQSLNLEYKQYSITFPYIFIILIKILFKRYTVRIKYNKIHKKYSLLLFLTKVGNIRVLSTYFNIKKSTQFKTYTSTLKL